MNISSVIVRPRPGEQSAVRQALAALDGVEIHAEDAGGRLIITLEDTDVTRAADRYAELHHVPGVLSATLIYQYSDDEPTGPSPVFASNSTDSQSEEVSP